MIFRDVKSKGMFSANYKTYKLSELYSEPSRNGLTKPSNIRGEGVKMVNMGEIFGHDRIRNVLMDRVPLNEKEKRNYLLQPGDLLFARQSLVLSGAGKCSIFLGDEEDVTFESHLIRTRYNQTLVNPVYLYYFFKSHIGRKKIESIVEVTAAAGIRSSDLSEIEITIPEEISHQNLMSEILTAIDDKIELNLQMNKTLEALARTLFKEWFVDFMFPGFDGELIDGLPKGWRVGSILEIADLLGGGTPKTEVNEYWNGSINWISAKDITANNRSFILSSEKQITESGLRHSSANLLPKYTTVITARGTVGNYCILPVEMAISQSNYGVKSNIQKSDYFVYLMIGNMIEKMKAFSYGTVFDTITTRTFREIGIVIPSYKEITYFNEMISPIFDKTLSNLEHIQSLTQIRETLLPKLITGKLKVQL